jgi:hypothetical protein
MLVPQVIVPPTILVAVVVVIVVAHDTVVGLFFDNRANERERMMHAPCVWSVGERNHTTKRGC